MSSPPTEHQVARLILPITFAGTTLLSQVVHPGHPHRLDFLGVRVRGGQLSLSGFEYKSTRVDWLHELARPEKSGTWAQDCHRFYVVAPFDVIYPNEVPAAWGLILVDGDRSHIELHAAEKSPLISDALYRRILSSALRLAREGFRHDFERLEFRAANRKAARA